MQVKNVPMVFDIEDNYWEKIFIENARFENISAPAFNIAVENNSNNSITLRNVWCSNVPVLAAFKRTGEQTRVSYRKYYVKSFDHGLQMESLVDTPEYKTLLSAEPVDKLPAAHSSGGSVVNRSRRVSSPGSTSDVGMEKPEGTRGEG